MLAVISTRVETSLLTEYHLKIVLDICDQLREEIRHLSVSEHHSALTEIYLFLRNLIPLHHTHAGLINGSGYLDLAIEFVVQQVAVLNITDGCGTNGGIPISTMNCLSSAVRLLESTLGDSAVVNNSNSVLAMFPLLKMEHIKGLTVLKGGYCIEEAVRLFLTTFAHFVCGREHVNSQVLFLHIFLDQAINMVREFCSDIDDTDEPPATNDPTVDLTARSLHKRLWTSIRLLGRDAHVLGLMQLEDFFDKRTLLVELIEGLLESADGVSFDMATGVMCVDAMATMGGWMDNSSRDSLATDRYLQDVLDAASVKFLKKRSFKDDCDKDSSLLNGDEFRCSEINADDEELMCRVRSSLCNLDLETTPLKLSDIEKENPERNSTSNGNIGTDDVVDFLLDWEVESTTVVCFKVMKLAGISRNHPEGLSSLASLDFVALAEVLIELLLDDRHGLSDEEGMQEKVIQLLTDLMAKNDTIGAMVAEHVDTVLEILADWNNFSDFFLIQTCMSALIEMAKFSTASRKILNSLDKIQVVSLHVDGPIFLLSVLELCSAIMPTFKKANYGQEVLMFNWLMQCFAYESKSMLIRACQLIFQISQVNPPFISKTCSRFEVEDIFLHILETSDDKVLLLASLRTMTILARNFNKTPYWVRNKWLSLPLFCSRMWSGQRELSSPDLMTKLLHLQYKFEEPFNLIILACSLDIISAISCLSSNHFGDVYDASNYSSKFYTIYMPLVAGLLAMITRTHKFCDIPEDTDDIVDRVKSSEGIAKLGRGTSGDSSSSLQSTDDESSMASPNHYGALMSMPLEDINPVYELLGAAAVNSLHSLILCAEDGEVNLKTYFSFAGLFANTPICETLIYIMIQLPNNYVAQVKGIIALEALLSRGIGARILSECCTRVLTSAIISFVDDCVVHQAFCSIVNTLSTRDERSKKAMVGAGVHKWLYVVIKGASPITGPLACNAVFNLINRSTDSTLAVGESGIVRPTLLLLEKFPDDLKVQYEGLQLITALCRDKTVFRTVKENKGEPIITASRKMLTVVLKSMPAPRRSRTNILSRNALTGSPLSVRDSDRSSPVTLRDRETSNPNTTTKDFPSKSEIDEKIEDVIDKDSERNAEDSHSEGQNKIGSKNRSGVDDDIEKDKAQYEYSREQIKDLLDKSTASKLSQQKCVVM